MIAATPVVPNTTFDELASADRLTRTVTALKAHGFDVLVAENGNEAKRMFFELVPDGSEVFLGASVTLEKLGIKDEVHTSGRFDAVKPKMFAMDRQTQYREIRKLGGAPDIAAGSAQAITEAGEVIIASNTGSQLGPYASGAGKVIWVVGTQKLVKDLDEGFKRIQEYCMPLEEQHMQQLYKIGTALNKILIVKGEARPHRTTIILVKEDLGY